MPTTHLTAAEKEIWLERFTDLMGKPGSNEEAFFAELRRSGGADQAFPPAASRAT